MSKADDDRIYVHPYKQGVIARFWGFDRLLASALIKSRYYSGLNSSIILAMLLMISTFFLKDYFGQYKILSIFLIVVIPVIAAGMIVRWRVHCEMQIIQFQNYNRLGEIRDLLSRLVVNDTPPLGSNGAPAPQNPTGSESPPLSASAPAACARCGAAWTPDSRFCSECGAPAAERAGA
jgi:hypothetical protein